MRKDAAGDAGALARPALADLPPTRVNGGEGMGWAMVAALAASATANLLPLSKSFRSPLPG